jgi:hypothetical protein
MPLPMKQRHPRYSSRRRNIFGSGLLLRGFLPELLDHLLCARTRKQFAGFIGNIGFLAKALDFFPLFFRHRVSMRV